MWKNFFLLHSENFNTRYISFPSSGFRLYHPRTATRLKGRRESVWKMNWKWKASFLACSVFWRWEILDTTENRLRNTDKNSASHTDKALLAGAFQLSFYTLCSKLVTSTCRHNTEFLSCAEKMEWECFDSREKHVVRTQTASKDPKTSWGVNSLMPLIKYKTARWMERASRSVVVTCGE